MGEADRGRGVLPEGGIGVLAQALTCEERMGPVGVGCGPDVLIGVSIGQRRLEVDLEEIRACCLGRLGGGIFAFFDGSFGGVGSGGLGAWSWLRRGKFGEFGGCPAPTGFSFSLAWDLIVLLRFKLLKMLLEIQGEEFGSDYLSLGEKVKPALIFL